MPDDPLSQIAAARVRNAIDYAAIGGDDIRESAIYWFKTMLTEIKEHELLTEEFMSFNALLMPIHSRVLECRRLASAAPVVREEPRAGRVLRLVRRGDDAASDLGEEYVDGNLA